MATVIQSLLLLDRSRSLQPEWREMAELTRIPITEPEVFQLSKPARGGGWGARSHG